MKLSLPLPLRVRPFAVAAAAAGLLLFGPVTGQAQAQSPESLRTSLEESGFKRYTPHDDLLEYLRSLRASSPEMRLGYFGETLEGRALPYAVFSRPAVTQPFEAWSSGKPVLVFAANVHGNERTHRESLLLLTRELATPGTEVNRWLDDLVIVVVPTINPDGFEATERGTRGNSLGVDMNRDYVKLEQQSVTNFIRNVLHRWRPHLSVDGHNGGRFPYNLTYLCTSNGSADATLTEICDKGIFPLIDRRMLENDYESWYYVRGTRTRWNVGGSQARIGRNYGGLANTVTILFESPGGQPIERAVKAGLLGYKTIMEYARDNAEAMKSIVTNARSSTAAFGDGAWDQVVVKQVYEPEPYQVQYKISEGKGKNRKVIEVTSDSLMKRPLPTQTRPRPYAYIIPKEESAAVDLLRKHGITVEVLEKSTTLEVDAYTVKGISHQRSSNQRVTVLDIDDLITSDRQFPEGTFIVPTDQSLGRLAAYMLEPETDDNVVYWNTMEEWVGRTGLLNQKAASSAGPASDALGETSADAEVDARVVPIYKLMKRVPLPARLLD